MQHAFNKNSSSAKMTESLRLIAVLPENREPQRAVFSHAFSVPAIALKLKSPQSRQARVVLPDTCGNWID